MSKKDSSKIALGAFIAAVAGYVAGVLTAPKSGKETREEIKDSANLTKREIEKDLKTVHLELRRNIKEAQATMKSESTVIKKEIDAILKKAKKAESKVKETLSGLHEGNADNLELDSALKEANSAIKHFKKYITTK